MIINIDIETRSTSDLIIEGSYKYAMDVSTEILCYAYQRFEDDGYTEIDSDISGWVKGQPHSPHLVRDIAAGATIQGWNFAEFDLPVWNHESGFPYIRIENVVDTMEKARMMGVPGALALAPKFLRLTGTKDMVGHQVMLTLCKHDVSIGTFIDPDTLYKPSTNDPWHVPGESLMDRLLTYCKIDVQVESAVSREMYYYKIPEFERRVSLLSHKINEFGFKIDKTIAYSAMAYADKELSSLSKRISDLTDGVITKHTQRQRIFEWLKKRGVILPDLRKQTLEDEVVHCTDNVAVEVMEIRLSGAKSSTAKFKAAANTCGKGDRVRGTFTYFGAPATGRWSGRGVQPHNLPRITADNPHKVLNDIKHGRVDSVYKSLSSLLRPMIMADTGKMLVRCDFSSIEGRVVAWLAGDTDALDEYRGEGKMYEKAAVAIYGGSISEVTKAQRQIGKVAELALGFGGGHKAFTSMATNYGVKVPVNEAKTIVHRWRNSRTKVVALWKEAEKVLSLAYRRGLAGRKGEKHIAGKVAVEYSTANSRNLYIELPSKRDIILPGFEVRMVDGPYGFSEQISYARGSWSPAKGAIRWPRSTTWGGSIVESLAQGIARDLLADAMIRLDAMGYDIIMHVHDEIVIEADADKADECLAEMKKVMSVPPEWAEGLPLNAEGVVSDRFGK